MSAAPISAAEAPVPAPVRAALERAGWPVAAWAWEQEMAGALAALADGDAGLARTRLAAAARMAVEGLPAEDLRQVTAAANLALLDGDRAALNALSARWASGEDWVSALQSRAGTRSSLFHLRLATKHPGGYDRLGDARVRRRWREGCAALAGFGDWTAQEAVGSAPDVLARWSRTATRLAFGDERKVAAAVGLLLGVGPAP